MKQHSSEHRSVSPTQLVSRVSLVVGFAIMGDSLLYGILPVAAGGLGLTVQQVGLLLSANRLVRLLSNTWVSGLFARFGARWPFIGSAVLGTVTALLYGAGWGFAVFLVARLAWGVAWSGLRQAGYQAVWTGADGQSGRLMGLMWGITRAGSAASVLIGGFLFDRYGYGTSTAVIAALTGLGILVAWTVDWPGSMHGAEDGKEAGEVSFLEGWRAVAGDPQQIVAVVVGGLKLMLDAVLVATASLFLAEHIQADQVFATLGVGVGTAAGVVLATRWLSDLFAGPLLGAVSDRVGQIRLAAVLVLAALASLSAALYWTGLPSLAAFLVVLVFSTGINVSLDAAANQIALRAPSPQHFIGVYTTAADASSAMGPLVGLPLVTSVGFTPVYLPLGFILLVGVLWWGVSDWRLA